MNVIDLDCPHCHERLQIDAAYAGSVCRCDECGQLMKVPRASAPEASVSRPSAPGEPAVSLLPIEPDKPRIAYVPIIAAAGVLIIAVVAIILYATSGSPNSSHGDDLNASKAVQGYDPDTNPFLSTSPNFLGVSIGPDVVLAIDASAISQPWFSMAKQAAIQLAATHEQGHHLSVIFWREEDPDDQLLPLPSEPITLYLPLGLRQMISRISHKRPMGDCQPITAINDILNLDDLPTQIVFITGQDFDDYRLQQFDQLMYSIPQIRLDFISIDRDLPQLKDLAQQHRGQYLTLSLQRLNKWYQESQFQPPNADNTSGP